MNLRVLTTHLNDKYVFSYAPIRSSNHIESNSNNNRIIDKQMPNVARKRSRDDDDSSSSSSSNGTKKYVALNVVRLKSCSSKTSRDGVKLGVIDGINDETIEYDDEEGTIVLNQRNSTFSNAMVAQEFMCACCWEILVQATTILPCGHTFCNGCIFHDHRIGAPNNDKCPTCRETIIDTVQNRTVNNLIEILTWNMGSSKSCFTTDDINTYCNRVANCKPELNIKQYKRKEMQTIRNVNVNSSSSNARPAVASATAVERTTNNILNDAFIEVLAERMRQEITAESIRLATVAAASMMPAAPTTTSSYGRPTDMLLYSLGENLHASLQHQLQTLARQNHILEQQQQDLMFQVFSAATTTTTTTTAIIPNRNQISINNDTSMMLPTLASMPTTTSIHGQQGMLGNRSLGNSHGSSIVYRNQHPDIVDSFGTSMHFFSDGTTMPYLQHQQHSGRIATSVGITTPPPSTEAVAAGNNSGNGSVRGNPTSPESGGQPNHAVNFLVQRTIYM